MITAAELTIPKPKRSHHAPKPPGPSVMAQAEKRLKMANAALVAARERLARARRVVEVETAKERDARRKVERAQKAIAEAIAESEKRASRRVVRHGW